MPRLGHRRCPEGHAWPGLKPSKTSLQRCRQTPRTCILTSFAGTRLQGARAHAALPAIVQQLGVACQAAYTARTYGELQAAIYGTAPLAPEQHVQHNGATPSIACGIDPDGGELAGGAGLLE